MQTPAKTIKNYIIMKIPAFTLSLFLLTAVGFTACEERSYDTPLFSEFTYTGNDQRFAVTYDPTCQYLNPILSGCTPDPAICRKGEDYYLANSSFTYFPGIPVWHSRDLVNWEQIGYALDRPDQLMLKDGLRISAGIYAPDIKYNPHNDTFYLIVTGVGCGGNFIVKTKDPAQGWSDPIPVPEVGGIDPSFLFDDDGKAYIVNNDAPAYPAEYDGHRAIWIREFDTETDKVCGPATVLVDKGVHPEEKPIWIEGPHLYHIGDTYYLMSAEGGTADWHSEVIFTAPSPTGPFKPCDLNPILTQRTLPHDRNHPITCAGHADLFQAADSSWWAIFLAVCTYEGDLYSNTGRSTFLLPVRWENGQPVILDNGKVIPTIGDKAGLTPNGKFNTGNGTYTDHFKGDRLDLGWIFLRTPIEDWYKLTEDGLEITPRPINLADEKQPSMICRWIKNATFTATTTLCYTPQSNKTFAGLACFQKEDAHFVIGKGIDEHGTPIVKLIRCDKDGKHVVAVQTLDAKDHYKPLHLRVEADGSRYTFSYSIHKKEWKTLGDVQDGRILSTTYAGGFTGAVIGLYATSAND